MGSYLEDSQVNHGCIQALYLLTIRLLSFHSLIKQCILSIKTKTRQFRLNLVTWYCLEEQMTFNSKIIQTQQQVAIQILATPSSPLKVTQKIHSEHKPIFMEGQHRIFPLSKLKPTKSYLNDS